MKVIKVEKEKISEINLRNDLKLNGTLHNEVIFFLFAVVISFLGNLSSSYVYDRFIQGQLVKNEILAILCLILFVISTFFFLQLLLELRKEIRRLNLLNDISELKKDIKKHNKKLEQAKGKLINISTKVDKVVQKYSSR
jgi:hypothetical protein